MILAHGFSWLIACFREDCCAGYPIVGSRSLVVVLRLVLLLILSPAVSAADIAELVGKTVVDVRLYRDGRRSENPAVLELVETRVGQPLSLRQVRESVSHLFSLGEFADVRVSAIEDQVGLRLHYDLIPLRVGSGVEVRGGFGRSFEEVEEAIIRRFGRIVPTDRIPDVVRMLEDLYRESGRFAIQVVPRPGGDGGRLVLEIDEGPVASIRRIELTGDVPGSREEVLERLGVLPDHLGPQ